MGSPSLCPDFYFFSVSLFLPFPHLSLSLALSVFLHGPHVALPLSTALIQFHMTLDQWRLKPIFATRAPHPVVRGPKVSHHSCYCVILHCIAQIDKRTLRGVFFVNNQDTI